MLIAAFVILTVAVLLGTALLVRARRRLGVVHGCVGATGLALAATAMVRNALRGPYAWDALGLLAAALLLGIVVYLRRPQGAVTLHAVLAGIGYLILAGFALSLV